jgi:hypothetical protein
MKLSLAIFLTLFSTSCIFIGEELQHPYPKIASVLKKKFNTYEDRFGYIKPDIEEEPGYLYIYQQKCIDFYHADTIQIKLKEISPKTSKIQINLQSSNKRWNFKLKEKEKSKEFLNALKMRLKTGKWPKTPWD